MTTLRDVFVSWGQAAGPRQAWRTLITNLQLQETIKGGESSNWLRNPIVSLLRIWPRCKRYFYGIQKYKSRRDSRVWYWPCKQLFEWLVYIVTWRACLNLSHAENETSIQFWRRPEEAQHPSHAKSFRYDLLGPDCTHVIIWMADYLYSYSIYPIMPPSY